MKAEINFITEKTTFNLKGKTRIKKWIQAAVEMEKQTIGAICIVFCSDSCLLEMNKQFLDHDYYTDIITFDYSETPNKKKILNGDIFISIDRVKENAILGNGTFDNELSRVMIHGILHLIGYKDKTALEKTQMRKKENLYLEKISTLALVKPKK
jgi:probable rRNA maturation factor